MIVDAHTHSAPRELLERAIRDPQRYQLKVTRGEGDTYEIQTLFWSLSRFIKFEPYRPEHYDPATRVRQMDQRGIQAEVLSGVQSFNYYWADPSLDSFCQRLQDLGVPIFVHPYGSLNQERLEWHLLVNVVGFPTEQAVAAWSVILGGVLDRFPRQRFCFGHGGGALLFVKGRVERGYDASAALRAGLRRRPSEYLDSVYVDTLIHDDRALRYIVETIRVDHLMFGTDSGWPMEDPDMIPRRRLEGVDEAGRERILGTNVVGVYRLARHDHPHPRGQG